MIASLPARGVWIEISLPYARKHRTRQSLPARGVWIEMANVALSNTNRSNVAPRKGSVD